MLVKAQRVESVDNVVAQPSIQPLVLVEIRRQMENSLKPRNDWNTKRAYSVPHTNGLYWNFLVLVLSCLHAVRETQLTVLVR